MGLPTHLLPIIFLFVSLQTCSGSFWDGIPLVSQGKSLVQVTFGDEEGAKKTQMNFLDTFAPVAVVRAVSSHIAGDHDEAVRIWKSTGKFHEAIVDSLPVVGHVKGGIHYAAGDTERGDEIMKSSSRGAAVIAGGVAGVLVGGPAGAVAGGAAAGAAMDGLITGIDTAVHKEYTPYGIVDSGTRIVKGDASVGEYVDMTLGLVGDGLAGYSGGKILRDPKGAPKGYVRCRRSGTCTFRSKNAVSEGVPNTRLGNQGYSNVLATVQQRPQVPSLPKSTFGKLDAARGGVGLAGGLKRVRPEDPADKSKPDNKKPKEDEPDKISEEKNQSESSDEKNQSESSDEKNQSESSDEENKSESSEEKEIRCKEQPQIDNRDTRAMADCLGKKIGERCTIRCKNGYYPYPSRPEAVVCKETGGQGEWDTHQFSCIVDLACRDHQNQKVDWFVAYKLPTLPSAHLSVTESPRDNHKMGNAFLFISNLTKYSDAWDAERWTSFDNTGWQSLDNTLRPLQGKAGAGEPLKYALYSDQPPPKSAGSKHPAHSKGILAQLGERGFFLPHSLPRWPSSTFTRANLRSPKGQIFMCVSLGSTRAINTVIRHLKELEVYVYKASSSPLDPFLSGQRSADSARGIVSIVKSFARLNLGWDNVGVIPTKVISAKGKSFDLFTKTSVMKKDIWSSMVARYYQTNIQVATFIRNRWALDPICVDNPKWKVPNGSVYGVEDVTRLRHATDVLLWEEQTVWNNTQEHAKWAVVKSIPHNDVFCMGDLNRESSQEKRSGGALCIKSFRVSSTFRDLILKTKCDEDPPPRLQARSCLNPFYKLLNECPTLL